MRWSLPQGTDFVFFPAVGLSLHVLPHSLFLPVYLGALGENFPLSKRLLMTQCCFQAQVWDSQIFSFLLSPRPKRSSTRQQQPPPDSPTVCAMRVPGLEAEVGFPMQAP